MTKLERTIATVSLFGALLGAVSMPAFAQDEFRNDQVMMVAPNGEVLQKEKADIEFLAMATKDVQPVPPGTMLVMHNGKLYVIADKKLPNGHMMSEMAFFPR